MRVFVLFLLILSACPGGGLTSESLGKNRLNRGIASLNGFVRHASVPVAGATVSMGDSTDITRADGGFSLIDLPSGAQTLRISASGFSELSFDVDVVLGSNDVGELQLRLAAGCDCADDELCTEGACVAQPYDCAASGCPVKSYCDNAQNKCVAGCLSSDHCPAGRVCDTKKNDCVCGERTHNCFGVCASNDAVATCGQACAPCIAPANATATCNGEACDFVLQNAPTLADNIKGSRV